jgi:membrane protease YdiL (CAAX protease family)
MLYQGFRSLYYLGLPAAALFWGRDAVVARFIGLQPLTVPSPAGQSSAHPVSSSWTAWSHDLGWAGLLGFASFVLLLMAALAHRKALASDQNGESTETLSAGDAAREALYREAHWAFYRNAPIVALGLYWGTWAGLGLVALEAAMNPMWRRDLREPGQAWYRASRGVLAVVSALLFLRTQNLWLALVLHGVILWGLGTVYAVNSPTPSDSLLLRE